jgi:hypothetical protein
MPDPVSLGRRPPADHELQHLFYRELADGDAQTPVAPCSGGVVLEETGRAVLRELNYVV